MLRQNFDFDWTFTRGRLEFLGFIAEGEPKQVDIPHDATIYDTPHPDSPNGASSGYYEGCTACYTKVLDVPENWRGQRIILKFDGASSNTQVTVNGHLVAKRPYAYVPFHVDLSEALRYGEQNQIRIITDNSIPLNSRWYTGTGLYRHIELLRGADMHIKPWGVFVRTESIDADGAVVVVEVTGNNTSARTRVVHVEVNLHDSNSKIVAKGNAAMVVSPISEQTTLLRLWVPEAQLWDLDTPNLHTANCTLIEDGVKLDQETSSFGIRTIAVNPAKGFCLNGIPIKLKGGCIHHDNGILGAAAFDSAEHRKVRLHKKAGFNALRSAHNPPSQGLIDACDKLGMLLMDEAFDVWNIAKKMHDYSMHFREWWERDIQAMVLRGRSHPSIIMWSLGNEMGERDGSSEGSQWAYRLAQTVRRLDPTRFVIAGVCGIFPDSLDLAELDAGLNQSQLSDGIKDGTIQDFMDNDYVREHFLAKTHAVNSALDIVGYNYLDFLYEETARQHPNRVICGTESFAFNIDRIWALVEKNPHVLGDFCWTSWDHLGEAGVGKVAYRDGDSDEEGMSAHVSPYPWRTTNAGDMDLLGFERPQLRYRQVIWGSEQTYIAVRHPNSFDKFEEMSTWGWPDVSQNWTWPGQEGKPIAVDIYTRCEEVELLLNGQSVGRKQRTEQCRYKVRFQLDYAPGRLEAISYTDGREVSRDKVETTGEAAAIRLIVHPDSFMSNGQDLCFVTAELVDDNGRLVITDQPLTATVEGAATLAGFGSANPITEENYTTGSFSSYNGRAMVVVRAGREKGAVVVTVGSSLLGKTQLELVMSDTP